MIADAVRRNDFRRNDLSSANKEAVEARVRIAPFTWNGDAFVERNAVPRPAESELTQQSDRPLSGEARIGRVRVEIAADDGDDSRARRIELLHGEDMRQQLQRSFLALGDRLLDASKIALEMHAVDEEHDIATPEYGERKPPRGLRCRSVRPECFGPRRFCAPLRSDSDLLDADTAELLESADNVRLESRKNRDKLCDALPVAHFLQTKDVSLAVRQRVLRRNHVHGSFRLRRGRLVPREPFEIPRGDRDKLCCRALLNYQQDAADYESYPPQILHATPLFRSLTERPLP